MVAGNDWPPGYILCHNQQFARSPARPDNLHRAVTESPDRLADMLCWRDERYVGQELTFSYERKRIMLEDPSWANMSTPMRGRTGGSRCAGRAIRCLTGPSCCATMRISRDWGSDFA